MPLWGTGYQAFLSFPDLRPGDDLTLFSAADTIVSGQASIAFTRGSAPGNDVGSTFSLTGCPNNSVVVIQGSNGVSQSTTGPVAVTPTLANMDASFVTVATIALTNGSGSYLDQGRYAFYRALVSTFAMGDVPVLIVKR